MSEDDPREKAHDSRTLEEIFEALTELPKDAQAAYLDEVCRGDAALRERMESWMASEERRERFMANPEFPDDPQDDLVGQSIGPYKVLQQLGEGGYGAVYLAEQRTPITRRVALKVIKLGMDTRQVIARFEAERQALAMMDHPNIAKVHDAGATESGRPYFVMELVRGMSITTYCDQCKLSANERLPLFMDVCRAVHHAHQKGVIHRDIKPSNILVTLHDGVPVPKVIDFGIAKATNVNLTDKTLFTNFQQFVGTPAYTSPEQVEMSGLDVDTRSDIYSLGVLLYELLTGTTPLDTEQLKKAAHAEIQRTIVESELPTPSSRLSTLANARQLEVAAARSGSPDKLRQALRGELDWIIMKALEKNRERRYDSANAFLLDVQHFLANEPVSAAAPSTVYQMAKFARRHTAAVAIGAALLLGGLVSVWQAVRATQANSIAQAQTVRAERNELAARKNRYLSDMAVAQRALAEDQLVRARRLLESHFPQPGQEDLRDFEWRYLWRETHREMVTFLADDDATDDTPPDRVMSLAFSENGNLMASSSSQGVVRVWNLTSREQQSKFTIPVQGFVSWVDVSLDGAYVAAVGQAKQSDPSPEIVVWDVIQRAEHARLSVPDQGFDCRPIQPRFLSETQLCAGDYFGNLWLWDLKTGTTRKIPAHTGKLYAIQASGDYLATTTGSPTGLHDGSDRQVNIWDRNTLTLLRSLPLPDENTYDVAISPDGKTVACLRIFTAIVSIYEADTNALRKEFRLGEQCRGVTFLDGGAALAVLTGSGTIRLFSTDDWQEIGRRHVPNGLASVLAVSANSRLMAAGTDNGGITVFPADLPDEEALHPTLEGNAIIAVKYSPDSRFIAAGYHDGSVDLWDAKSHRLLHTFPSRTPGQMLINDRHFRLFRYDFFAFSPDSRLIAIPSQTDSGGFTVGIWNLATFEETRALEHPSWVAGVTWLPDSQSLVTITMDPDRSTRLWDVDASVVKQIRRGGMPIASAVTPDGRYLAWDTQYSTPGIRLWKLPTLEPTDLRRRAEGSGNSHAIVFSPNGQRLAVADPDYGVVLWDTATWQPVRDFIGHRWMVTDLSFSSDGKRLASAGRDSQCLLWDVESGREVARFQGNTADLAPDGSALAAGGAFRFRGQTAPAKSSVRIYRAPSLEEIDAEYSDRQQ